MMRKIWMFLMDSRLPGMLGLVALAAFFYLGAQALELAPIWAIAAMAATLLLAAAVLAWRRRRARRASDLLGQAGTDAAIITTTATAAPGLDRGEVDTLRAGMLSAIATIRQSKMGLMSGARALYELPWYLADKAAGWGEMPLHLWLRNVVKDPGAIAQLEELLGAPEGRG